MNSLSKDRFIALFSLTKFFLISLPEVQCIFMLPYTGASNRPPLFDWRIIDSMVHY